MEFLVSSKGGVLCCLNGHIYSRIRTGKEKIFWRCRNKYGNGCNASLTTNLEKENPVINGIHNHQPDQPMIDLIRTRNRMKEHASQTNEKPVQIYSTILATCEGVNRFRRASGAIFQNNRSGTT